MAWRQQAKSTAPKPKFESNDDDWDTDTSYQNVTTEKSQRYGSASVPGSGRVDHVDFNSLQEKMKTVSQTVKEDFKAQNPTRGYGGKYGTEKVMDKVAQDFSYKADIEKHSSQTDGKKGFGGTYGIDERAKDKSAETFDYKPTVEKHSSQTNYTAGFGSKKAEVTQTPPASPAVAPKPTIPVRSKPATPTVSTPPKPQTPIVSKPVTPTITTAPKPAAESPVSEKPESTTSSAKVGVGSIRAKFENIKKEKDAETQKRVAEERNKRLTVEKSSSQQPTTPTKVKQQETSREPSPIRAATPPAPEPSTNTVEEPAQETTNTDDEQQETSREPSPIRAATPPAPEPSANTFEEPAQEPTNVNDNQQETNRFVGSVNVSAILRKRRDSSPSPNIEDEEWADDN